LMRLGRSRTAKLLWALLVVVEMTNLHIGLRYCGFEAK
jgi:hypothetical protein